MSNTPQLRRIIVNVLHLFNYRRFIASGTRKLRVIKRWIKHLLSKNNYEITMCYVYSAPYIGTIGVLTVLIFFYRLRHFLNVSIIIQLTHKLGFWRPGDWQSLPYTYLLQTFQKFVAATKPIRRHGIHKMMLKIHKTIDNSPGRIKINGQLCLNYAPRLAYQYYLSNIWRHVTQNIIMFTPISCKTASELVTYHALGFHSRRVWLKDHTWNAHNMLLILDKQNPIQREMKCAIM